MAERKNSSKKTIKTATKKTDFSRLYRSERNRMIAGVCGGLGEFFNVDPSIVRFLFLLIIIFGGSGILLYIVLWIILPTESEVRGSTEENIKANAEEIRNKAENFVDQFKSGKASSDSRSWWGVFILIVGLLFLLSNFGIFHFFDWGRFWPVILIVFGLVLLTRSK